MVVALISRKIRKCSVTKHCARANYGVCRMDSGGEVELAQLMRAAKGGDEDPMRSFCVEPPTGAGICSTKGWTRWHQRRGHRAGDAACDPHEAPYVARRLPGYAMALRSCALQARGCFSPPGSSARGYDRRDRRNCCQVADGVGHAMGGRSRARQPGARAARSRVRTFRRGAINK